MATPASATLGPGGTTAALGVLGADDGGGTINAAGLFTAGATVGGPLTVTAIDGALSGTASVTVNAVSSTSAGDFFGPLGGWLVAPAATGNADTDTANLQTCLNEVGTAGYSGTLYIPAGTYLINKSLVFRARSEATIVGADPATTIIRWAGPTANASGQAMFIMVGATISQVNRITFDGQNQINVGILDGWKPSSTLVKGALGASGNASPSAYYGVSFTTENVPLKIGAIQRWIPANTTTQQAHTLQILDPANNYAVVASWTLSANRSGGSSGNFQGAGFAGDVTLLPAHTYYVVSEEFNGGDPWYDDSTAITPNYVSIASINGSVTNAGGTWQLGATPNRGFGPLTLWEDLTAEGSYNFPTNNSFSDLVVKNFQGTAQSPGEGFAGGIWAQQVSETLLERCTFSYCGTSNGNRISSGGGVYLFGQNTIDWWVRDCQFDHNSVGITTNFGGYSLQIDNCVFNSNTLLDVNLPQGYSAAVRNSTSINSNQFVNGAEGSEYILQNDTILDPSSATLAPISLPSVQLTLMDTTIRNNAGYTGPDVVVGRNSDILAVGNTFAVASGSVATYNPYSTGFNSPLRTVDCQVVDRASPAVANLLPQTLLTAPPQLAATYANQVQEVVPTNTAVTDTANLNTAVSRAKAAIDAGAPWAAIHLQDRNSSNAYTAFNISSTIVIPAGYPIVLVGDGETWAAGMPGTALSWSGASGGTMIDLAGPSCATIMNLGMLGNVKAGDGIRVENADQVGGNVYADELMPGLSQGDVGKSNPYTRAGVFADGLSNTNVELAEFQADGANNVKVVGGATPGAGGQVGVFMGAASSEAVQYDVSNGGKLMVQDQYLEEDGGQTNQWAHVDNGTYTVQGAEIKANAAGVDAANPPISISGTGNLSVLSVATAGGIIIQPGATANVLAAGNGQWGSASGNWGEIGPLGGPVDYAANAQVALLENANSPDQINANIADTNAFIRQMLAQTRTFRIPTLPATRSRTVTDVRFFNVQVAAAVNNVHIVGSAPTPVLSNPPPPTTPAAPTNVTALPGGAGGSKVDISFVPGGPHLVVFTPSLPQGMGVANNYTGLVGMRFTTGACPIVVTQLGRWVVPGNSQSHTLQLVQVSNLSVVGSATLPLSLTQGNQFAYASLANPVTLLPNTQYYLVSQETSGGDNYSGGGVTWTNVVQSIDGMVKYDATNGWQLAAGTASWGPLDLVAEMLPDMAGAGLTHGVDANGLAGAVSNNDFEGMQFTTGSNPVTVAYLGRWIPKNTTTTQTHTLELVDTSNGNVLGSATLSAGQTGGANGQFQYAQLASPIALAANHSYYLASQEFTGGDQKYNAGTVMRPSGLIKSIDGFAYYNGASWAFVAMAGHTNGPVDFLASADTSQVTYNVYRSTSPSMAGAIRIASNLATSNYLDTAPGAGTHYYTVTASNGSGESTSLGVSAASTGTALPGGWTDADWNSPPAAGSAWTTGNNANSITVQGGGDGYSNNQWHFAYESLPVGTSFTATVQLTSFTQYGSPAAGTMAALMISDGGAGLSHTLYVDVVGGSSLQWSGMYGDNEPMPAWLKLVATYSGGTYTVSGYYLDALGNWVKPYNSYINPSTINNPAHIYVGVAVCACNDYGGADLGLATATFANFSVVDTGVATPAAPTGLTATPNGSIAVNLSWTAPAGTPNFYNIYRGVTPGGEGTTPYATGIIGTTWSDTSVNGSATYYYRVAAVNAGGAGALSNEAAATLAPATLTITGTPADDTYTVRLNVVGDTVEILRADALPGQLIAMAPLGTLNAILFDTGDGHDRVVIDASNGNPFAAATLGLQSGTVTVAPSAEPGTIVLSSLWISDQASLDLGGNTLVVQGEPADREAILRVLSGYIATGRNSRPYLWEGPGIISSAAAAEASGIKGLAAILNADSKGQPILPSLPGVPLDPDCVLVKYTLTGDTDLNGRIDASDYLRTDYGLLTGKSTYRYGDFNYDQQVAADDYAMIDAAFLSQSTASPSASRAAPKAARPKAAVLTAGARSARRPAQLHGRRAVPEYAR